MARSRGLADNPKLFVALRIILGGILLLLMLLPIACAEEKSPTPTPATLGFAVNNNKVTVPVSENDLNIAFAVITDTHVESGDKFERNRIIVGAINDDGSDHNILGVVHMGDMVHVNSYGDLSDFRELYEKDYQDPAPTFPVRRGLINFPVFPTLGNHDVPPYDDKPTDWDGAICYLGDRVRDAPGILSYNNSTYAWRWGNYYFIQLGLWAGSYEKEEKNAIDEGKLAWLKDYLATHVGDSGYGVLIFQHYGWDSFSKNGEWWNQNQRDRELEILRPYNVLGIFTGHVHSPKAIPISIDAGNGVYFDNYSMPDSGAGSNDTGFSIVTLTGTKLQIATKTYNRISPPNEWSLSNYEKDIRVGPRWRPVQWSSVVTEHSLGRYNAGGGGAIADIDGNGKPDLLLMGIEDLDGANSFRYKIGWDLDTDGKSTNWGFVISEGGLGGHNAGGGAAIADIDGNGKPDLLLMGIDDPDGANKFWYRIGWDLKTDSNPTKWGPVITEGGLGWHNAGGGAAIGDIDGNGKPDLLLMGIDDTVKQNEFWYKIGWDLKADGAATSWSHMMYKGGLGWQNASGGAAMGDIDGNGKPDLLLMGVDDPDGPNRFWYTIGWDFSDSGS